MQNSKDVVSMDQNKLNTYSNPYRVNTPVQQIQNPIQQIQNPVQQIHNPIQQIQNPYTPYNQYKLHKK